MQVPTAQKICFGAFEFDRQTAELWKNGTKLKLQGQPIAVLALLLEVRANWSPAKNCASTFGRKIHS